MFKILLIPITIFLASEFSAQATLIHYLRHVEPAADSIIQSHFDECFINRYITMSIEDCQVSHADGKFMRWDDKIDSSKILSYRFYYIINYDSIENLTAQISLQLLPNHAPMHNRFNGNSKIYNSQQCELLPLSKVKKIATDNGLKGNPKEWKINFFFNAIWNNNSEPGVFELHIFRYYGGKNGNKKFQGHIYNLANGALMLKTKGKVESKK